MKVKLCAALLTFLVLAGTPLLAGSRPLPPQDIRAASLSHNQIYLSWKDSLDDEDGYWIERGTDWDNFVFVTTVPPNSTVFYDQDLNPDTYYFYRVQSHNAMGKSNLTSWVSAKTGVDMGKPSAPINPLADASGSQVQLTFNGDKNVSASFSVIPPPVQYHLIVSIQGKGKVTFEGEVCSSGDCDYLYNSGTSLRLIATADSSSYFAGWEEDCNGLGRCDVSVNSYKHVRAVFIEKPPPPAQHTLRVSLVGTGNVTVNGAVCSTSRCDYTFEQGTAVRLSATARPNFSFTGWDQDCTGSASCDITMDGNRSVRATFTEPPPISHSLDVTYTEGGAIHGTGVTCDNGACMGDFLDGASREIFATPLTGFQFDGCSGDCSGKGSCQLIFNGPKNVGASFSMISPPPEVILKILISGNGVVTGEGISCDKSECDLSVPQGELLELSATPKENYIFDRWEEACSGSGVCRTIVNDDITVVVRAVFSVKNTPPQSGGPASPINFYFEPFTTTFDGTKDSEIPIRFNLSAAAHVKLWIIGRAGIVNRVYEGELSQGSHEIPWDITNEKGEPVSSGAYKARLSIGGTTKDEGIGVAR